MAAGMKVRDLFAEIAGVCKLNSVTPDVHYRILRRLISSKKVSGKADVSVLYDSQKDWMEWLVTREGFDQADIVNFYDVIHAITFEDYDPPRVSKYESDTGSVSNASVPTKKDQHIVKKTIKMNRRGRMPARMTFTVCIEFE